METEHFAKHDGTVESPTYPVETASFVSDAHDIPEGATYLGVFTDEYSPTDASAVYEVDCNIYVKIPAEA